MATDLLSSVRIPLLCLAIVVMLSNFTVCVLVCTVQKLRTYTNAFVVSLAISDILIGGILLPAVATPKKSVAQEYLISIALLSGVFNICAVTYDRYVAVMKPLRYSLLMRRRFPVVLTATWTLALAISLLPLFWNTDDGTVVHRAYMLSVEVGCVLVPHMFIFAGHYKIFREVRRFVRREKRLTSSFRKCKQFQATSEVKVAKVFIVIAVTFALSWLPVEYMTTAVQLGRPDLIPTSLRIVSLFTIALGSLVNPVVYSFMKPDFRRALKRILKRKSLFKHRRPLSFRKTVNTDKETTVWNCFCSIEPISKLEPSAFHCPCELQSLWILLLLVKENLSIAGFRLYPKLPFVIHRNPTFCSEALGAKWKCSLLKTSREKYRGNWPSMNS